VKAAAWLYYFLDRRLGKSERFDRLYSLDADPFGCEKFSYERQKSADLLDIIQGVKFKHILDIGCGAGTLTRMLAEYAENVTAIDFSETAIELAVSHPSNYNHVHYQCADIRTFELRDYDLIICSEILYYLKSNELEALLDQFFHTQRSGTKLLTVGKKRDSSISEILGKRLLEINRIERGNNYRPYSIIEYEFPRPSDHE
jgi:SAM-dependent methyltransferase